jgi:NAD(P)-dependent dehydrogenase (short-subunit alcohol dehydrogenase family)
MGPFRTKKDGLMIRTRFTRVDNEDAGAVLITGGSRGIGAAVARRLGRLGRRICISYRVDAESAQAVVAEVVASGGDAIAVQAKHRVPVRYAVRRLHVAW